MRRYRMWLLMVLAVGTAVAAQDLVVIDMRPGPPEVRITPANPTALDAVSVTVCGWKPGNNLVVDHADLEVQGDDIQLDLYWHTRPAAAVTQLQGARAAGSICQTQSAAAVTRYELTPPYEGVPYEVTESLATFGPGTYTLYVTNYGPVSGSASTTFTVSGPGHAVDPIQNVDRPWWWAAMRGDAPG